MKDNFSFGTALDIMKHGGKVAREGWNGKGMFAYYVKGASYQAMMGLSRECLKMIWFHTDHT